MRPPTRTRVPASPIFRRANRGRRDTWSGKCVHISPPLLCFCFDKTAVPVRARRTRTPTVVTAARSASIAAAAGAAAHRLVTSGALTLDLGVDRRLQPLGPLLRTIAAPREVVFDVIAAPYLERTPQALEEKLQVWERGSDMVLAAHHTHVKCGVTTTLETVRFERPDRVDFRLVRGPVPHVVESFLLTPSEEATVLRWQGELGTDLWALGLWWGHRVALAWEHAVDASFASIANEAERRARNKRPPSPHDG